MGQDISKAFTPPPLSFCDCLVNGQINLARYIVINNAIFYMLFVSLLISAVIQR